MQEFSGTARFEVLGRLGSGGFGSVYRVRDGELGRVVALKQLAQVKPDILARFKQEFRILSSMNHENLIALHDLFSDEQQWFYTMELVEGDDWLQHVRGAGPPLGLCSTVSPDAPTQDAVQPTAPAASRTGGGLADEHRLRSTLVSVAQALEVLHEAGIVHRDIKPSNVMVTRQGRVVVLDLGIALTPEQINLLRTETQLILGTPGYMAPEQAVSPHVTPAADWYAFGVMLFEGLTGRLPFEGTAFSVLTQKQSADGPDPRLFRSDIPTDLAELCLGLLRRDPSLRATGQEVLRTLSSVVPAGIAPSSGRNFVPGFVGRNGSLDELRRSFERSRNELAIVVLHGPSGMGKSALARTFLERLGQAPVKLVGCCYQNEFVPYKAFDGIVDALGAHLRGLSSEVAARLTPRDAAALAKLFPVLERVPSIRDAPRKVAALLDAHTLRRRAFAALRELLVRMSDERPVILCIDDVQWSDEDSAQLLVDLVTPPDPPALLLMLLCRSDERSSSHLLAGLNQEVLGPLRGAISEMELGPLSLHEAEELVQATPGAVVGIPSRTLLQESGGSPFFLRELSLLWNAREPGPGREIHLTDLVEARLGALGPEARALLEVLSVRGRPLPRGMALEAAGIPRSSGTEVISSLKEQQLLRSHGPHGEGLETFHDRIRESVLAGLSAERLGAVHRALVKVLESAVREGEERDFLALFTHSKGGGLNPKAAEFAREAAARAEAALAFHQAVRIYQEALTLEGLEDGEVGDLQASLGTALANAGHGPEAARSFRAAADRATGKKQIELRRKAAEQLLFSGKLAEGLAELRELLELARIRLPSSTFGVLATLLFLRVWIRLRGLSYQIREERSIPDEKLVRVDLYSALAGGLSTVDNLQAQVLNARQLLLTLSLGEPTRLGKSLAMEAAFRAIKGVPDGSGLDRLFREAEKISAASPSPELEVRICGTRAMTQFLMGRWKEADRHFEQHAALQRERGGVDLWERDASLVWSVINLGYLGDLRRLSERVTWGLQDARDRGDVYARVHFKLGECSWARLMADEPEGALADAREAIREWKQESYQIPHFLHYMAIAYGGLYTGQTQEARELWASQQAALRRSMILEIASIRLNSLFLIARCWLLEPASESLARVARVARKIRRERVHWAPLVAGLLEAGIACKTGKQEQAKELLRQALEVAEKGEMACYAAVARWRLGELEGGARGNLLARQGRDWLVEQGVKNPEAFSRMFAPGVDSENSRGQA